MMPLLNYKNLDTLQKIGQEIMSKEICSTQRCGKTAVVKRWLAGFGPCPVLMVHLCDGCKDIPLWCEDVIKEEKIPQRSAKELR
jgi:hypothetical protein